MIKYFTVKALRIWILILRADLWRDGQIERMGLTILHLKHGTQGEASVVETNLVQVKVLQRFQAMSKLLLCVVQGSALLSSHLTFTMRP